MTTHTPTIGLRSSFSSSFTSDFGDAVIDFQTSLDTPIARGLLHGLTVRETMMLAWAHPARRQQDYGA
jgi:hypothetical protein